METNATPPYACPVCRDEAPDEPCPGCEVAESFDDAPLTPGQEAMLEDARRARLVAWGEQTIARINALPR